MDTMKQLLLFPVFPAQLPQSPLNLFSSCVLRDHCHIYDLFGDMWAMTVLYVL